MSRVSLIEKLYVKRKSALEFNYDALWVPPIYSIFTQADINELYYIATSPRYNGDIEKKYELIDTVMQRRGFRKAHSGTNRVVYNFLEMPTFVAKVAIDKVGLHDTPAEYRNQEFFKPFCCKIFEVDSTGVIGFVERVNPITSLEEFLSVADDVFNLMITKIIGKYVVDDLGTEKFMNYGLRYNSNGYTFGPVIIDFPYAYELDGGKLICQKPIDTPMGKVPCNGEIDYDGGLNHLICTRCGRKYTAMDLQKNNKNILIMYGDDNLKGALINMRARIISGSKVIMDSGYTSKTILTEEDYEALPSAYQQLSSNYEEREAIATRRTRKTPTRKDIRREVYSQLQQEQYNSMVARGIFENLNTTKVEAIAKVRETVETEDDSKEVSSGYYTTEAIAYDSANDTLEGVDTPADEEVIEEETPVDEEPIEVKEDSANDESTIEEDDTSKITVVDEYIMPVSDTDESDVTEKIEVSSEVSIDESHEVTTEQEPAAEDVPEAYKTFMSNTVHEFLDEDYYHDAYDDYRHDRNRKRDKRNKKRYKDNNDFGDMSDY